MQRPLTVITLTAAVLALRPVAGSVDEFQCACGYNAQKHVKRLRTLLGAGVDDREVAKVAAAYGALAGRMLLVAHGRPGAAPTAGWLWLLNMYANTVLDRAQQRWQTEDGGGGGGGGGPVADGVDRVDDGLREYVRVCSGRGVARDTAEWTQQMFEKYVLENMTAIVADDGRSEDDYRPRWLYLNDVAAAADGLGGVLARDVGVDWTTAASRLRHVHGLAKRKWMFGTAELVLFQKKFLRAVAASAMGHVLVHVNLCRAYWAANMQSQAKDDGSAVDEYSRVWMSVGSLLESFRTYLDVRRGSDELRLDAMLDVAANPALDDDGFDRARRAVVTCIADVGDGLFGVRPAAVDGRASNAVAAVQGATAGAGDSREENPLLGLIALVDNNISTAEKYLKTVQGLLQNVDFKIVHDFMKSTHIWLT